MIAPLARSCATSVESNGGTSIAKLTSLFDVVRMSFVSYGSLNAATTQYIGSAARSGLRAVLRIELRGALERIGLLAEFLARRRRAGRQRARGGMRVELALAGDRAFAANVQRFERVDLPGVRECRRACPSAATTLGSETVGSMRPNSSGSPWYLSRSGKIVDALTVFVGNDERRAGAHVARRRA